MPRVALPLLALIALAACEGGGSGFTGAPPPSYDGVWTGTAQRTQGGERNCPGPTPFVVTIASSVARGEVRDRRDRTVTASRFEGVVDADGRLTARAWYNGVRNDLELRYNGERFTGTIRNDNDCVFNLRLARG